MLLCWLLNFAHSTIIIFSINSSKIEFVAPLLFVSPQTKWPPMGDKDSRNLVIPWKSRYLRYSTQSDFLTCFLPELPSSGGSALWNGGEPLELYYKSPIHVEYLCMHVQIFVVWVRKTCSMCISVLLWLVVFL